VFHVSLFERAANSVIDQVLQIVRRSSLIRQMPDTDLFTWKLPAAALSRIRSILYR
jgi:hypothetical protein